MSNRGGREKRGRRAELGHWKRVETKERWRRKQSKSEKIRDRTERRGQESRQEERRESRGEQRKGE